MEQRLDQQRRIHSRAFPKSEDFTLINLGDQPTAPDPSEDKPSSGSRSSKEVTNVPGPIPDTGLPPPHGEEGEVVHSKVVNVEAGALTQVVHTTRPEGTPLPPLLSLATPFYPGASTVASAIVTPTLSENDPIAQANASAGPNFLPEATGSPESTSANHHIPKTTIILLSVCGALVVLGTLLIVKLVRRPRRRKTPTPSLPILQDGMFPDKYDTDGSPIFGGKERLSSSVNIDGRNNTRLWPWTQYQSGIPKAPVVVPLPSFGSAESINQRSSLLGGPPQPASRYGDSQKSSYPFTSATQHTPLQPVQNAITRAVSRLSTVSMSLYPNSPNTGYVPADVGLAIDGTPPLTADGHPFVKQSKDKGDPPRSRSSILNRNSMIGTASAFKDTVQLRRSRSFAYGGMDIASPSLPAGAVARKNGKYSEGGRARIKSTYYTPGLYPRVSTAASGAVASKAEDNSFKDSQFPGNGMHRSESRRRHDTDALVSAIGLASPSPVSPQPTLYPDDSMSVIGDNKKAWSKTNGPSQSKKKPVPRASVSMDYKDSSPTADSTAHLGSLMLVDFAASKSTASLVHIHPSEGREQDSTAAGGAKANSRKRVEDKPPRVPSPPPLPSLAQMALAHANPAAYSDYHSPTYSIYGLYDGDRKSRGTSFGY